MRLNPIPPGNLSAELRFVHHEIARLTGKSQSQVNMTNESGALLGPFIPMLQYPQFGIPALGFLKSIGLNATLPDRVREVTILTVGGALGARFELYAHGIMAEAAGIEPRIIAKLATGAHPDGLNEEESIAHTIAHTIVTGRPLPDSTFRYAVKVLGKDQVAEVIFLVCGYTLIAMLLNGFDIPAPEIKW